MAGDVLAAMQEGVFLDIRRLAAEYFKHSHHSQSHTDRVYSVAVRIGISEKADLDVIKAAALLHDIARALEDEGKIEDHAVEGARMAKEVLLRVNFPGDKIESVLHCIRVHRFSKGAKAESLEAKILQDADRLDVVGAVGLARTFATGGWANIPIYDPEIPPKKAYDGDSETSINHIYEKVLKIKDELNTSHAKKIAKERHKFVEKFLERFLKEWKGDL